MFLKQEEWFLNQLKTEIPVHLPGHPQMDQQSLKEKVKYSFSVIQQISSQSQDHINHCTSKLGKAIRMGWLPFLGLRSKGHQQ